MERLMNQVAAGGGVVVLATTHLMKSKKVRFRVMYGTLKVTEIQRLVSAGHLRLLSSYSDELSGGKVYRTIDSYVLSSVA